MLGYNLKVMTDLIKELNKKFIKNTTNLNVKSGDTFKVYEEIQEGSKERIQIIQGLVIKTTQPNSHMSRILVRRIASGIGVEKSFLIHSPLVEKIEITKRSKVRRNYLTYMRQRTGKAARLASLDFDKVKVNKVIEEIIEKPDQDIKE